jgi:hypothetical protein
MMKKTTIILFAVLVIALASATDGRAAVERAFVSVTGDDANACTQTFPCRSLAGALLKVFEGGEIIAVDSGIYGIVEIDKSVTIMGAPGVYAAVGVNVKETAVVINAPADSTVVLRNLHITTDPHLISTMKRGIDFISGRTLRVENCVVAGFKDFGIRFNLDNPSCESRCPQLSVEDTFVRENGVGIAIRSAAVIEHSRVEGNTTGVQLGGRSQLTIRDSIVATNGNGLTAAFLSTARVESCSFTDNEAGLFVLESESGPGNIYVSNTLISGNKTGLKIQGSQGGGGKIYSFRTNRLFGNGTDGNFTQVLAQQ